MPMKKTSTPPRPPTSPSPSGPQRQSRPRGPKEATLRFLRLFARSYYADSRLPEGLQGLMLN